MRQSAVIGTDGWTLPLYKQPVTQWALHSKFRKSLLSLTQRKGHDFEDGDSGRF